MNNPNIILQLQNLSKYYHDKIRQIKALDGICLDIYEGEILALLGVNGAGKTTLSSLLATLTPPTAGDILYNGTSIYNDIRAYRSILGFVPQRPNLDSELNVEENLYFAGKYFGLPDDLLHQRVSALLEQLNLNKYTHEDTKTLSGGYKQRLLIGRALIHGPKIVIMDEPTVALDPNVRRQLWQIIKQLKENGITVIITTHYLDEAECLSDRVCILSTGKILLIDKASNLKLQFNKPNLEEVFLHLTQEEAQ